ncbi:hypothetical protein GCM10009677_01510 [Sphaerisporangium rubeum]
MRQVGFEIGERTGTGRAQSLEDLGGVVACESSTESGHRVTGFRLPEQAWMGRLPEQAWMGSEQGRMRPDLAWAWPEQGSTS